MLRPTVLTFVLVIIGLVLTNQAYGQGDRQGSRRGSNTERESNRDSDKRSDSNDEFSVTVTRLDDSRTRVDMKGGSRSSDDSKEDSKEDSKSHGDSKDNSKSRGDSKDDSKSRGDSNRNYDSFGNRFEERPIVPNRDRIEPHGPYRRGPAYGRYSYGYNGYEYPHRGYYGPRRYPGNRFFNDRYDGGYRQPYGRYRRSDVDGTSDSVFYAKNWNLDD